MTQALYLETHLEMEFNAIAIVMKSHFHTGVVKLLGPLLNKIVIVANFLKAIHYEYLLQTLSTGIYLLMF